LNVVVPASSPSSSYREVPAPATDGTPANLNVNPCEGFTIAREGMAGRSREVLCSGSRELFVSVVQMTPIGNEHGLPGGAFRWFPSGSNRTTETCRPIFAFFSSVDGNRAIHRASNRSSRGCIGPGGVYPHETGPAGITCQLYGAGPDFFHRISKLWLTITPGQCNIEIVGISSRGGPTRLEWL